jgi:hypothetical protein
MTILGSVRQTQSRLPEPGPNAVGSDDQCSELDDMATVGTRSRAHVAQIASFEIVQRKVHRGAKLRPVSVLAVGTSDFDCFHRGRHAARCWSGQITARARNPRTVESSAELAEPGHKALNLVTHGLELTYVSICRDVSAVADEAEANREALCYHGRYHAEQFQGAASRRVGIQAGGYQPP